MAKYKIFAGLGGGVNSYRYSYTDEFDSEEEASNAAYQDACDDYENYAGSNGIMGWSEAKEEASMEFDDSEKESDDYEFELEAMTNQIYNESRGSWISYSVEEVKEGEWEGDPDLDPNN